MALGAVRKRGPFALQKPLRAGGYSLKNFPIAFMRETLVPSV
jgi:hypothetical protein